MKRFAIMTFVAALAFACGGKKDKDNGAGSAGSGSAAVGSAMADNGSAGSAMAGSAAQALGSAGSDTAMAGSGAGSAGSAAAPVADTAIDKTPIDVPTQSDFEAEAQKKITEKNLESEISAMEKQLAN